MERPTEHEEKESEGEEVIDLRVEELEEVIAPRLSANHNETFVIDEAV